MNDQQLSQLIQEGATRHRASERLKAAVRTQIALHTAATQRPEAIAPSKTWGRWSAWLGLTDANAFGSSRIAWMAQITVAFALGALLTLALVMNYPNWGVHGSESNDITAELLDLHVRALGPGPLYQIGSSDRHTVKPWFQGKLDYAPEVPDLREAGFDLQGGRIDRVQGHPSAALAYQLRKHIISAYVLPIDQTVPLQTMQRRGFSIAHWSDGVMQVWAVTDADANELTRFESAWMEKAMKSKSAEFK